MIEQTPECVLMTYQVPERGRDEVLKEDLEKLHSMEQRQPQFSPAQKEELTKVRSWIHSHTAPQERQLQSYVACGNRGSVGGTAEAHEQCPAEDSS